ncbi:MAG: hypothetical protein J6B60_02555 [Clostridia bacterium]|nr:hypothetical protein [Clostridia bacterium]
MLKIINNTGSVVVAYNDKFNIALAINETKIVPDEFLINFNEMCFKYFSLKNSEIESGWEKGISRYYYLYNKKINIPTITKINVNDVNEIILEKNETNINVILIKTMCVKNILCKTNSKIIENQRVNFLDSHIRKKLLLMMTPKLIILILCSVILALTVIISEGTLGTKILIALISLLLFLWWLYSIMIFVRIKHYNNENAKNKPTRNKSSMK